MPTYKLAATDVMIYGLVEELMNDEGLTVEEARERLMREVDEACDEIAYRGDDG